MLMYVKRASVLIQHSRRFCASVAEKPAEANPAGKASNGMKYAFIGVPIVLLGVVVTDIVCNVNHRNALENVCPSFVSLVRTHYGFDDEDPEELARIKFVKELQARAVNVRVRIDEDSDSLLLLEQVDGDKKVVEVLTEAFSNDSGSNRELLKDQTMWMGPLCDLQFEDPTPSTEGESSTSEKEQAAVENVTSPTLVHRYGSLFKRSLFSSLDGPQDSVKAYGETRGALSGFLERYDRCGEVFYSGLQPVRELGSQNLPLGQQVDGTAAPKKKKPISAPRVSMPTSQGDLVKIRAKQRVAELERLIMHLESEKRLGLRDFDAIEAEIRANKSEISEIRRKHLNYFYFF